MTQNTQPRVYVRYTHPQKSDRSNTSCGMFSWIALAEYRGADLRPQDPFDQRCPRCGVEGENGDRLTECGDGDAPSRYRFPKEINPEDVPAGYPLLVTNHGYLLTS